MQNTPPSAGLEQSIHEIKESISHIAKTSLLPPPDKLLSEKEVARIISMSTSFLQHDRQRGGGIPYVKIGARVRYRKSDIDTYIASKSRLNTSEETPIHGVSHV